MAGSMNNSLENKVLDHVLGGPDYVRVATVYVALYTVAPTDAGGGTELTIGVGSYARVAVTNNDTNWPNAAGGSKSNGATIEFPQATADWGEVVAFAIHDHATDATEPHFMCWGDLAPHRTVTDGDVARFLAGTLVVTQS